MENLKILTCPNCGANLNHQLGMSFTFCKYCDSVCVFENIQINNTTVLNDNSLPHSEVLKPRLMQTKEKFAANYFESASNAQGGWLWVADTEIFFKPHSLNYGNLSKKFMRIRDIDSMEKTTEMFGLSKILTIRDKNGNSMKLVSWDRDGIITAIERGRQQFID